MIFKLDIGSHSFETLVAPRRLIPPRAKGVTVAFVKRKLCGGRLAMSQNSSVTPLQAFLWSVGAFSLSDGSEI